MWPLALILVPVGAFVAWMSIVEPRVRAKRERLRREAQRRAPAGALLAQAQDAVRYEKWQRFEAGERLLALATCTDEELLAALKAVVAEATDEDRREGRGGRESNFFELYDSGLAEIMEVVEARLAGRG